MEKFDIKIVRVSKDLLKHDIIILRNFVSKLTEVVTITLIEQSWLNKEASSV